MPADGILKELRSSIGDSICEKTVIASFAAEDLQAAPTFDSSELLTELIQRYPVVTNSTSFKQAIETLESSVQIESVYIDDAKDMAIIYEESSAPYSDLLPPLAALDELTQWYEDAIHSESKTFWKCELQVAQGKPELIGHCNIERVSRTPRESRHFIGLYVAGPNLPWTCGKLLAQHLINHCEEKGVGGLFGFTRPENRSAIKLLRHFGFAETGTESEGGSEPICFRKKF